MDRRSRERFIESNNQIASLVEKFKVEGAAYRKFAGLNSQPDRDNVDLHQKVPLTAYGRSGTFNVFSNLIKRMWTRSSPTNLGGLKNFSLKFLLMPTFFFLLWIFYYEGFKNGADVSINGFDATSFIPEFIAPSLLRRKTINTKEPSLPEMALYSIASQEHISCPSLSLQ